MASFSRLELSWSQNWSWNLASWSLGLGPWPEELETLEAAGTSILPELGRTMQAGQLNLWLTPCETLRLLPWTSQVP